MALSAARLAPRSVGTTAHAQARLLHRAPQPVLPRRRRSCAPRACASGGDVAREPEAEPPAPVSAVDRVVASPVQSPRPRPAQPAGARERLLRFALERWDLGRVARCTSADTLLELTTHALALTPRTTAAALHRLVTLLAPGAPCAAEDETRRWTADPRVALLIAAAEAHLVSMRQPRLLFRAFFDVCALYGFEAPQALPGGGGTEGGATASSFLSQQQALPPRSVTQRFLAVSAFHRMHARVPPAELARALRLCARLGERAPAAWASEAWTAMALRLPAMSPGELAGLLDALRAARAEPPAAEILDALWRSAAAAQLPPAQKLAALEACGPGRTAPHAAWLGAFWEESAAEVAARRWGAPPLVRTLQACAALAVLPPEPWLTLLWGQTAAALSVRAMRFAELPALLLACAEVGARPPDAWAEAMFDAALCAADGGAMSAAQTADLLAAVKRLRLAPPKGWAVKMLRHDAGAVAAR